MSAKPSLPKKKPAKNDLRGVIAWNVRTLRVSKGWSQEQLALTCELDRTYVSAIERCVWNISISNIERLALSLEVEPWMLLKPA
jgi:transcriptional regulator with XRE-family HTH domain